MRSLIGGYDDGCGNEGRHDPCPQGLPSHVWPADRNAGDQELTARVEEKLGFVLRERDERVIRDPHYDSRDAHDPRASRHALDATATGQIRS